MASAAPVAGIASRIGPVSIPRISLNHFHPPSTSQTPAKLPRLLCQDKRPKNDGLPAAMSEDRAADDQAKGQGGVSEAFSSDALADLVRQRHVPKEHA